MDEKLMEIAREAGLRFHTSGSPSVEILFVSGHAFELELFAELVRSRSMCVGCKGFALAYPNIAASEGKQE